jgi:hypothetical protein
MHMPALYLKIRTGYYRVVVDMLIVFSSIAGHIVDMAFKVRVLGSDSGAIMKMFGTFACFTFKTVPVQFVIHIAYLLL